MGKEHTQKQGLYFDIKKMSSLCLTHVLRGRPYTTAYLAVAHEAMRSGSSFGRWGNLSMRKESETIYADLGFENLMAFIYGWYGHNGAATRKPIRQWKRELMQLFGTLRTAIEKNVTGDDRHKEKMMERCNIAVDAIRHAKSKDQITCAATQFAFELIFKLLGRLPYNQQTRRAHHSRVADLSAYRTLSYTRTAHQRVKEIIDYSHTGQPKNGEPTFEGLIKKLKRDFSDNPHKFLSWVKAEHRSLYDRFN